MVKGTSAQQDIVTVFGTVFAGGKSSRMGSDKAMLVLEDMTLLDFQFKKLSSILGSENVIVSGDYISHRHILDQELELGPLGGIISVVREFKKSDYFIFLPVDMPNMTEKTLSHIIGVAKKDPVFDCWSYKNFEMPLLIRNHKMLEKKLNELILQPKNLRSVRRFFELMKYRSLDLCKVPKKEFLNMNTIREFREVTHEYSNRF